MTSFTITGGPVFWLLLILAVAAIVVYFERLIELRRCQIDWQDFINGAKNILKQGNVEEALAICEDTMVPVANVVAVAIRNRDAGERSLREAVDSQKRADASRLVRRLSVLSVIGEIAPLLGLLGTIIGFIKTILLMDAEALVARADLMNSAMEAMVAAALGLMVMIPVVVMATNLRNRMNRIVSDLDAAASQIVGFISSLHSGEAK